jgi:hypothetical protein
MRKSLDFSPNLTVSSTMSASRKRKLCFILWDFLCQTTGNCGNGTNPLLQFPRFSRTTFCASFRNQRVTLSADRFIKLLYVTPSDQYPMLSAMPHLEKFVKLEEVHPVETYTGTIRRRKKT